MSRYYRMMLGSKGAHTALCLRENFIGILDETGDLSARLNGDFESFQQSTKPQNDRHFTEYHYRTIWTVCHEVQIGDVILGRGRPGEYAVGEVTSDYFHRPNEILGHRRAMKWSTRRVARGDMSPALKSVTALYDTIVPLHDDHAREITTLIGKL